MLLPLHVFALCSMPTSTPASSSASPWKLELEPSQRGNDATTPSLAPG